MLTYKLYTSADSRSGLWSKWVKIFQCESDYRIQLSSRDTLPKQACLDALKQKTKLKLTKLKQAIVKKPHAYTRQLDLKSILSEKKMFTFQVEFYDKTKNMIFKDERVKLSTNEMSVSLVSTNLSSLDSNSCSSIQSACLYAYRLCVIKHKISIHEFELSLKDKPMHDLKLFENKLIEVFDTRQNVMFAIWNGSTYKV
jgi:hypothetical protein